MRPCGARRQQVALLSARVTVICTRPHPGNKCHSRGKRTAGYALLASGINGRFSNHSWIKLQATVTCILHQTDAVLERWLPPPVQSSDLVGA